MVFTPLQAQINMLYEQAMSYHYMRHWKILSRLPSIAIWSREYIISLLRDLPRSGKTLHSYFFDMHRRIAHYEFIHVCFDAMARGLWQSCMRDISDINLSAVVEIVPPLILPFLLNSQVLIIDQEWLTHPVVSEIINNFNIGYLFG